MGKATVLELAVVVAPVVMVIVVVAPVAVAVAVVGKQCFSSLY